MPCPLSLQPPVWTATPSSFRRIGLDLDAGVVDDTGSDASDGGAAPHAFQPAKSARCEAVLLRITAQPLLPQPGVHLAWRLEGLLASLAERNFLLGLERGVDDELPSALLACAPHAHLAVTRLVERCWPFQASMFGRVANLPQSFERPAAILHRHQEGSPGAAS